MAIDRRSVGGHRRFGPTHAAGRAAGSDEMAEIRGQVAALERHWPAELEPQAGQEVFEALVGTRQVLREASDGHGAGLYALRIALKSVTVANCRPGPSIPLGGGRGIRDPASQPGCKGTRRRHIGRMTKPPKPVDTALKAMFQRLETRRLPEHLRRVVDQLEGEGVRTTDPRRH